MLKGSEPTKFENWVCVMERGTEYEVQLAHNFLKNLDIPSNILSKRDSSYNLNFGEMSMVYLYVPKDYEKIARESISSFLDDDSESDNRSASGMEDYTEPGSESHSASETGDRAEPGPGNRSASKMEDRAEPGSESHSASETGDRAQPGPDNRPAPEPGERTEPENGGDDL